jgi:dipeptidyl aminopeptidase/acylaminoacyl peptidase
MDRSVSAAALAAMGAASSPSFSPDGERIAYVSNASGSPQVWIVSLSGGAPVQVTDLPDPVQQVRWSPAGTWLAYDVAPGGGLNVQIHVVRPDGGDARRLTAGGKVNNTLGGWTHDGRALAFGTNQFDPARMDAFLVDPEGGQTRPVGRGEGMTSVADVSRDGALAVVNRLVSRSDNNLYLARLDDGRESLLTPHAPPANFGWGALSPDGRTVYVATNAGADRMAFGAIELDATGQPGPLRILAERPDAEAESAVLDNAGRTAALVWNVGGRSELAFLDVATGQMKPAPQLPCDIAVRPTFSPDGRRLAFVGMGAAAPPDIWVLDLADGRYTQVTQSPHEGVKLAALARPTLVAYAAHDGLPLSGWLYRPSGAAGPGPLVFLYHGGPEGQARPLLDVNVQALAARGISVFLPNVRGSTGYGRRFANLDNGPLRVGAVRDIAASTQALVDLGLADPARLGVMGGSYGGYMVMAGVTEYPAMFAAAANLYGIVNFETFFEQTEPWMAAISTVKYGDPATQRDLLRALSPIHKLDRITTPLIVLHGANDTNVPVIEAEQIVASLQARGVPVEYVLFPDEGHGWRRLPNRIRSAEVLADFFERRLTGP